MINEPLFQSNIISTMYKYLSHYLSFHNWALQYLAAMVLLYVLYKLLMHKNLITYHPFLPTENYKILLNNHSDKVGLLFLCISVGLYIFNLFNQETSFFANYDTMCVNTMRAIHQGITPLWGINGRFSPIAFWDVNFIYSLTHNAQLINIYVIAQICIFVYLSWKLLSFIPIPQRCLCIGLIIISPAFFWNNLISYPERWLIIYFFGSLLCLKKYGENPTQKYQLWFAVLLINLALYTKETTILIYFGVLCYSFLNNLWNSKITPKSFLHPVLTLRQFPMEILIFSSMLIFALFYLVNVSTITDSQYISIRQTEIGNLIKTYHFELSIIGFATILWLFCNINFFLLQSLIIGGLFSTLFIIFILKLSPFTSQMENKTYYLILPYIISLIALTSSLACKKHKNVRVFFLMLIGLISLYKNYNIYKTEEGKYYKDIANLLITHPEPLSIFISENSEPRPWWYSCWSSVYKYYYPKKQIKFSTSAFNNFPDEKYWLNVWHNQPHLFHPITDKEAPKKGDFYIIKKTSFFDKDKTTIKKIKHQLIYNSKLFEVYKIK